MTDDPRHGTVAGYNRIPCRDDCCRLAMARYKKRWSWDAMNGRTRIVCSTGTRRRIEGLMALGWSGHEIGKRLGSSGNNIARLRTSKTLTAAKAAQVARLYDRLSMRLPTGNRQAIANVQNLAKKRGYLPPLAWDDESIDDPATRPSPVNYDSKFTNLRFEIDEVVVERVLAGDSNLHTTVAEKREVVRRWEGTSNELARLTGWKVERYADRSGGATCDLEDLKDEGDVA